jgi:hypothetical protein
MKPLAERLKAVDERFKVLEALPKFEPLSEQKPEPTREELVAAALARWIEDAPAEFWRELDQWVKIAHSNSRANIKDHSDTTFGLGFEAACEMVRDKFKSWRQPGNRPPKGD